jgi:hypothetical protein
MAKKSVTAFNVSIPAKYKPEHRKALAQDIINFIIDRTQKQNVDKNNRKFPKYSKEYMESIDFRVSGKKKGKVDLTLSGDMLSAIKLINDRPGELRIGIPSGDDEAGKAEGNILGTYGQSRSTGKRRDFMGITQKDLNSLMKKFDSDFKVDEMPTQSAQLLKLIREGKDKAAANFAAKDLDGQISITQARELFEGIDGDGE